MIVIKQGKEKNLIKHHPWVFSGAIDHDASTEVTTGIQKVVTNEGRFIAWGWYDEKSHIELRLLSWDEKDVVDEAWWRKKVRESVLRRKSFFVPDSDTNTFRIIHGEADMLAGFAADVYGKIVRIIISARVAFENRKAAVDEIESLLHPQMIILNTDVSFCGIEAMKEVVEYYKGGELFIPEHSLDEITIKESGIFYSMIPGTGQKSGFFCDQRENRLRLEKYTKDAVVFDGCCYTGSFTLHALRGGAKSVDAVDASADAVSLLKKNINLNASMGVIPLQAVSKVNAYKDDIFNALRNIEKDKYDVIILDPPKLAKTAKALEEAKKGYKDLNRLAMSKIKDNGVLVTCSCSGALSREDFRTVLAWSAKDSNVEVQVLETLGQGCDHPIRLSFPESEYLKVFILRIIRH